jgi:hypothetical protein
MRNVILTLSLLVALETTGSTFAVTLPTGVTPFTEDQVKHKYVGHGLSWENGTDYGYMGPDGKFTGYYGKKGDEGIADGSWTVSGNEFCYDVTWTNIKKSSPENYCWKLYRDGKKVVIEDPQKSDGGIIGSR